MIGRCYECGIFADQRQGIAGSVASGVDRTFRWSGGHYIVCYDADVVVGEVSQMKWKLCELNTSKIQQLAVGVELEYDPELSMPEGCWLREEGTSSSVGTDGRSDTLEIRSGEPFTSMEQMAEKMAEWHHQMLSAITGKIAGGNGVRRPVGLHLHLDTMDSAAMIRYLRPLWGMLQAFCDSNSLYRRMHAGGSPIYGGSSSSRGQSKSISVANFRLSKRWMEYRGGSTPPTPEILGFLLQYCLGFYEQVQERVYIPKNLNKLATLISATLEEYDASSIEGIDIASGWEYTLPRSLRIAGRGARPTILSEP